MISCISATRVGGRLRLRGGINSARPCQYGMSIHTMTIPYSEAVTSPLNNNLTYFIAQIKYHVLPGSVQNITNNMLLVIRHVMLSGIDVVLYVCT